MEEEKEKNPAIYVAAIAIGVVVEYLGILFERVMITQRMPAQFGFPLSGLIFVLSPFLSTGIIIYVYTRSVLSSAVASALVIPAFLLTIAILGI